MMWEWISRMLQEAPTVLFIRKLQIKSHEEQIEIFMNKKGRFILKKRTIVSFGYNKLVNIISL